MDIETAKVFERTYGYVPKEDDGESWTVWRGSLVVVHPGRRPRVYEMDGGGRFTEPDVSGLSDMTTIWYAPRS